MERSRKKRRGEEKIKCREEEEEKCPVEQAGQTAGVSLILRHPCRCVACTAPLAQGSGQAPSPSSWFTLS